MKIEVVTWNYLRSLSKKKSEADDMQIETGLQNIGPNYTTKSQKDQMH